ncbi:MAG TPA: hypothetical protein VGG33_12665 [Polyangia bacterium]
MPSAVLASRRRRVWLAFAAATALSLGCSPPDAASVDRWKTTPEASEKLAEVIKDTKAPAPVRGRAAAALVEVGLGEDMEAAVAGLDIDQRAIVIPAAVPVLAPLVGVADAEKSGDARDALFALRAQSTTGDSRKAIEAVLFPAFAEDIRKGRQRAGRYQLADMLTGLGKDAVPLLLPLLEDPAVPLDPTVEVLAKVGDAVIRQQGGEALVKRAKKLNAIPENFWPALSRLAGKTAAEFAMATVDKGVSPDDERAAAAMVKMPPRSPGLTAYAVAKAADPNTPAWLRDQMFLVAEQDPGLDARKELINLIKSTKDGDLRIRAYQVLVKASTGDAILEGLEAFPANAKLSLDDFEKRIVEPLSAMPGMNTRAPLFKAMESKSPLGRLVAVRVLDNMNFKSDAEPLAKLEKDRGTVAGLPPSHQVGRQAQRAVAKLRKSGM